LYTSAGLPNQTEMDNEELIEQIEAMREDIQALPRQMASVMRRLVIEGLIYIAVIVILADLGTWLYKAFVK
jgi:hypothetical protein